MAIDLYDYNNAYFKNSRDTKKTIDSEDIDKQFADLVHYINNDLKTAIDTIITEVTIGIQGSPDALFQNNGAVGTAWSYINENSIIKDGGIFWGKLTRGVNNSILATNNAGVVTNIAPIATKQLLKTIIVDGVPQITWQSFSVDLMEARSITGNKIALKTISLENLAEGAITPEITVGTVTDLQLAANAITTAKIRDSRSGVNTFNVIIPKIGVFPSDIPKLTVNRLLNKIRSCFDVVGGVKVRVDDRIIASDTITTACFAGENGQDGVYIFGGGIQAIAPKSITWEKIYQAQPLDDARKLGFGSIVPERHIIAGSINKNCFDDATKALFTAKGL